MSITLLVGSKYDIKNYFNTYNIDSNDIFSLRYIEQAQSVSGIIESVYSFLCNDYLNKPKYIITESVYVIGYLCSLLKANNLLAKGVKRSDIEKSFKYFVKIDFANFKAFEIVDNVCRDLMVKFDDDDLLLINDDNYPNEMIHQISINYQKLLYLEELTEFKNE